MSTSPWIGITSTSESFVGSISWACPCGRLTLRPDDSFFWISSWVCVIFFFSWRASTCTASALTMKMITITRNTSVSGVMLISAKIVSPPSSAASSSGSFPIAIAVTLHAGFPVVVVFALELGLLGAAGMRIARLLEQQLEELVGKQFHLGRDAVRALAEEV